MKIEEVGSNLSQSFKKITKNKKLMIVFGVGAALVLFMVLRNKNSNEVQTVALSGYPSGAENTGSIGGGGDNTTDQFSSALDTIQNNFSSLITQQNQNQQKQLEAINASNAASMGLINDSIAKMSEAFQTSIAGQQSYFDKQYGALNQSMLDMQKQMTDQQTKMTAELLSYQNRLAALQVQGSGGYYSGSSSSSSSSSSSYSEPSGYGGQGVNYNNSYNNTSQWSQKTGTTNGGTVGVGHNSSAAQNSAGSVYNPSSGQTVYYNSSGQVTGIAKGQAPSSGLPVIRGTVVSVTKK